MAVRPMDMEKFTRSAGSLYEAIVVTARRARQIHQDIKIEFNQRVETLQQLSTTTETEEELDNTVNPDQLKISMEFEKRPKPTEVALQELAEKKIAWRYKEPEVVEKKTEEEEEGE
ncbi:MAG TPA: DNA-directed RNA polymerase subunit omega [Bacteroidota bacterium]|nr:DNA-directed RNA polymerase subunit omega [Bacteroidota bacterium]